METLILVVLALSVLILLGLIAFLVRRSKAPPDLLSQDYLEQRLEKFERRLVDELDRFRNGLHGALREDAAALTKAQRDLALDLTTRFDDARPQILTEINTRFDQTRDQLDNTLAASRKSQDERLDLVGGALQGLTNTLQQETGELRASLLEAAGKNTDLQTRASGELKEAVMKSLGDAQTALVTQFGAVQRDLNEALTDARKTQDDKLAKVDSSLGEFAKYFLQAIGELRDALLERASSQSEAQAKNLAEMRSALAGDFTKLRDGQTQAFAELQDRVQNRLDEVRRDNEDKLEKIRAAVEDKLQSTLETRLGESFRQVSERLEQVYRGLGEMQTLATGVGDLKRVLTNVRSRGAFGEVQLAGLLEQVLTPEQYVINIATVPGSSERVEFAIKLPGRDDSLEVIYLPIDAKFPLEDYQRLQQAFEDGDAQAVEEARTALRRRTLLEAKTIRDKYLSPPNTTDFAILFLPTEGLYAEILRIPGLSDEVQRLHRVVAVGPTNLQAFLNSLQMGFRTLAIEKRSSEVWRVLGAVKTEFAKFGDSLDAVSKKLQEAGTKIEDTARRSRAVERSLRRVDALAPEEAVRLLPVPEVSLGEGDGEAPETSQPAPKG